jgi:hypothetical protein
VAWIRRVRTASGATAVQIAEYDGGRRKIVAHVGSAHTEAELGILLGRAREMLADPAQGAFGLGIEPAAPSARLVTREASPALFETGPPSGVPAAAGPARVVSADSRLLFHALDVVYGDLGFGVVPMSGQRRLIRRRDCSDLSADWRAWQGYRLAAGRNNQRPSRKASSGSGGW